LISFVVAFADEQQGLPQEVPNFNAAGIYRDLKVTNDGLAVGVGAVAYKLGVTPTAGAASIDAGVFTMNCPANNQSHVTFYVGYLKAAADWNKDTKTVHIAAAAAELGATFISLNCFYDQDGTPGFQYSIGKGLYCNDTVTAAGKDCIDHGGICELNQLIWNPITVQNMSCPAGYDSSCRVYRFTATDTTNVITFHFDLASQPCLFGGANLDNNYAKITLVINYPWTSKMASLINPSQCKVLLIAATAGRAGAAGATITQVRGDPAIVYNAGGASTYFNWQSKSIADSNNVVVYQTVVSGQSIKDFDLSTVPILSLEYWIIGTLQIIVAFWTGFQYNTQFLFFVWDVKQPNSVTWDPTGGHGDGNTLGANALILFGALCVLFFNHVRRN